MRVALAGIVQEALIFSPLKATGADFGVQRGAAMLTELDIEGVLRELEIEPVPLLYAHHATPSGVVDEAAYLGWRDEILRGLAGAGLLDGVCLVLHGAMTVENVWSAETDLVREVRALLGNEIAVVGRFDPHTNFTEELANKLDTLAAYRTAPHRDAKETLHRALRLLRRRIALGHRTRPAYVRLPLLLPGERATTGVEPMKSLLAMAADVEREKGILNAEVIIGFGWADTPYSGSGVLVTAEDDAHVKAACRHARRLAQAMWDRRHDFTYDQEVAPTVDEAIDRALAAPEPSVFLTDSGDNVTAGAPGDSTYFLSRLLAKRVPDAIVAGIPDAEVVARCVAAGVGATVSVTLGGKLAMPPGGPLSVTGVVEHLDRPEAVGASTIIRNDYSPTRGEQPATIATLRIDGVRVLVTSRRMTFAALDDVRRGGVEPLEHKILVVKLGYLLPRLRDAAPREILALSPGYSDMDYRRLPYKYVTRPIIPLDDDFAWRPVVTSVAGYVDEV